MWQRRQGQQRLGVEAVQVASGGQMPSGQLCGQALAVEQFMRVEAHIVQQGFDARERVARADLDDIACAP